MNPFDIFLSHFFINDVSNYFTIYACSVNKKLTNRVETVIFLTISLNPADAISVHRLIVKTSIISLQSI